MLRAPAARTGTCPRGAETVRKTCGCARECAAFFAATKGRGNAAAAASGPCLALVLEAEVRNLPRKIVAGYILHLMRFIEDHGRIFRQDAAEVVLLQRQIREEEDRKSVV